MLRQRDWYLGRFGRLAFDADGDGGGGTGDKPADPLAGLTPEQQREIDRRMAAARKQAEAEAKRKHDEAIAKAKTDADKQAEIDLNVKSGEFDKAKALIESERDGHKATAETLKAENAEYAAIAASALTEREKALAELGNKELSDAYPKDASPIERWKWFESPLAKVAIAAAAGKQDTTQTLYRAVGSTNTPKPNGSPAQSADAERARLQKSGKYDI